MDVLSSTGILTPDIRFVTSFESTRVAPGSASLFSSHPSKGYRRCAARNTPACTTQIRDVETVTETGASLCRTTKACSSKPVIVRYMPVTKEMSANCAIVARIRQRLTFLSTPVCNNLAGPKLII